MSPYRGEPRRIRNSGGEDYVKKCAKGNEMNQSERDMRKLRNINQM